MNEQPGNKSRLNIIHLLGWMLGCGAVLACYRLVDLDATTRSTFLVARTIQALFAIVYGAALGGLVLVVCRRWRGERFPSQPGHWLLVLGGLGCLIDGGTMASSHLLGWADLMTPSPWYVHQAVAWSAAGIIGVIVTLAGRGAGRWRAFAAVATAVVLGNAATNIAVTVWYDRVVRGIWLPASQPATRFFLYEWPSYLRIGGESLAVAVLLLILYLDRRCRAERDWLHWAGVLVAVALATIDVGQIIWLLVQSF